MWKRNNPLPLAASLVFMRLYTALSGSDREFQTYFFLTTFQLQSSQLAIVCQLVFKTNYPKLMQSSYDCVYDFRKNNHIYLELSAFFLFLQRVIFISMDRTLVIDNIKQVAAQVLPKGSALYLYGSRSQNIISSHRNDRVAP